MSNLEIQEALMIKYVGELFSQLNMCKSHDIHHIERVVLHVKRALVYDDLPRRLKYNIIFAAILHDCDDTKFCTSTEGKYSNATNILKVVGISQKDIDQIIKMISYVSCSANGDNIPEDCKNASYLLYPRYADRLDALGKIGIRRCYQYILTKKDPLYTENTLKPKSVLKVWDIATEERYKNYQGKSPSMIDHYYDKLLRLADFDISNKYFLQARTDLLSPLLSVIEAFVNGVLTHKYMAEITMYDPYLRDLEYYKNIDKVFWVVINDISLSNGEVLKANIPIPCIYTEVSGGKLHILQFDSSIEFDGWRYTAWRKVLGTAYNIRVEVLLIHGDRLYKITGEEVFFDSLGRSDILVSKEYLGKYDLKM